MSTTIPIYYKMTFSTTHTSIITTLVSTIITVLTLYFISEALLKKEYQLVNILKNIAFFAVIYYVLYNFIILVFQSIPIDLFQPKVQSIPFVIEAKILTSFVISSFFVVIKGFNPITIIRSLAITSFILIGIPFCTTYLSDNTDIFPKDKSTKYNISIPNYSYKFIPNIFNPNVNPGFYRQMGGAVSSTGAAVGLLLALRGFTFASGKYAPLRASIAMSTIPVIAAISG